MGAPPMGMPPMPGGPGFPPPRRGGGGVFVPLLIIGVVVVMAVVGVIGFIVLRDDDSGNDPVVLPSYSRPAYTPPTATTTNPLPTTTRRTTSDPASLLSPTIETARGNTFTRAGTRTESCITRANPKLLSTLRTYPCVGTMSSAVYANPSKQIMTVISIAKFSGPSAANGVSNVTNLSGWPKLLTPSEASRLPQPRANPAYWTRTWTRGSNVVWAQSYWSHGGPTGGRTGSVFSTAGELGVEVTNTMLFTN
ncbi:hypothetical protein [Actinomadura roseirufa]|uniref:hypothetical protein n=1 Tax=Actinomadura roseirufa TaxID=2094049 RepID=UPI00104120F4|nr:hypothetical protein [Actinomadura roseirufa]